MNELMPVLATTPIILIVLASFAAIAAYQIFAWIIKFIILAFIRIFKFLVMAFLLGMLTMYGLQNSSSTDYSKYLDSIKQTLDQMKEPPKNAL